MTTATSQSFLSRARHLFLMVCVFLLFFIILAVGAGLIVTEITAYTGRIFKGISVGSIDASGRTVQELVERIEAAAAVIQRQGVEARYDDRTHVRKGAVIPLQNTSFQNDLPLQALGELFTIDAQKTAERAYALGRNGAFPQTYIDRISFLLVPRRISADISFNKELFLQSFKQELVRDESFARDAAFSFDTKDKKISIEPDRAGFEFDREKALHDTLSFLHMIQRPRIILNSRIHPASLSADMLMDFKTRAQQLVQTAPITLTLDEKKWQISDELLARWLTIEKNGTQPPLLALDTARIASYIEEVIAPEVRIEAKTARFEMKDGRVTAFEQQENGKAIDSQQSALVIRSIVLENNQKMIPLVVKNIPPPLVTDENRPLVHDILASAETDFSGSPKNRIFNISLGAQRIHGILIEPGKEFSLISFLGKIDEKSGFLPELVIKGSKTTPEFGGGLCQVSTTLFRTVAAAGLPILERRNHSYRVSYYEPPIGFDATVYYPKPDFRFFNDTKQPILIQTAVKKTKITMTIWGTKDGRITAIDAPTISNRKAPGKTKIVETDTLKPGEKKCVERAHAGADAVLERRVTYPNGDLKKDIFKSHYVVWPAVCFVGKKTDDADASGNTTSTPPPLPPPLTPQ